MKKTQRYAVMRIDFSNYPANKELTKMISLHRDINTAARKAKKLENQLLNTCLGFQFLVYDRTDGKTYKAA